jgi:hypothetical protein
MECEKYPLRNIYNILDRKEKGISGITEIGLSSGSSTLEEHSPTQFNSL